MDVSAERESTPTAVRRGWWSRNWKRLILTIILVPLVGGVAFFYYKFGPLLFSDPYRMAFEQIQESPCAQEQLGTPIKKADWAPRGSVRVEGNAGEASLFFAVTGPKIPGKTDVTVKARLTDGKWGFSELSVMLPEDKKLDLTSEANERLGVVDTVRFDPKAPPPKDTTPREAPPDIKIDLPPDVK